MALNKHREKRDMNLSTKKSIELAKASTLKKAEVIFDKWASQGFVIDKDDRSWTWLEAVVSCQRVGLIPR